MHVLFKFENLDEWYDLGNIDENINIALTF